MKRLNAPDFWPIEKKTKKYIITPSPGPHKKYECIPLGVFIRDFLGYAKNLKEVKEILNKSLVKVDGIVRKEYKFPIGLMDIVSIGNEFYLIYPTKKGLSPIKISEDEAKSKLLKVMNKTIIKGNKIQLNLHDGKNIITDKKDIKTKDTVVFSLVDKKISDIYKYEKGAKVVVIKGNNMGKVGIIENINDKVGLVTLQSENEKINVPIKYIFVIG